MSTATEEHVELDVNLDDEVTCEAEHHPDGSRCDRPAKWQGRTPCGHPVLNPPAMGLMCDPCRKLVDDWIDNFWPPREAICGICETKFSNFIWRPL